MKAILRLFNPILRLFGFKIVKKSNRKDRQIFFDAIYGIKRLTEAKECANDKAISRVADDNNFTIHTLVFPNISSSRK